VPLAARSVLEADAAAAPAVRAAADGLAAAEAAAHGRVSGADAMRSTGAAAALGQLDPSEKELALLIAHRRHALDSRHLTALRHYESMFERSGQAAVYPIGLAQMRAYIADRAGRMLSSSTLNGDVSLLRVAAKACGRYELAEADEAALLSSMHFLERTLPAVAASAERLPLHALELLVARLDASGTLADEQMALYAILAVNFQLRGSELLGPRGTQWRDLREQDGVLVHHAVRDKTHKFTLTDKPRVAGHVGGLHRVMCPIHRWRRWLRRKPDDESVLVFRQPLADGSLSATPWPAVAGLRQLVTEMRRDGVKHDKLTDHWGRKTGYNFWRLDLGRKPDVTALAGGRARKDKEDATVRHHYQYVLVADVIAKVLKVCTDTTCCSRANKKHQR
jgi:hypothetical protein